MFAFRVRPAILIVAASGAAACSSVALASGCTSFTADPTTPLADAAAEETSVVSADAAASDASADGTDAGPACADSTTVLLGIADPDGGARGPDYIAAANRDAHYFIAATDGRARCAWLYIVLPPSGNVYFGLYSGGKEGPSALIAHAKFPSPLASGWNHAPLAEGAEIKAGTPMWIAVGPDQGGMKVNSLLSSACYPQAVFGSAPPDGTLSNTWSGRSTGGTCSLAAYLGR